MKTTKELAKMCYGVKGLSEAGIRLMNLQKDLDACADLIWQCSTSYYGRLGCAHFIEQNPKLFQQFALPKPPKRSQRMTTRKRP